MMLPREISKILKFASCLLVLSNLADALELGVQNDISSKICGTHICNGASAFIYWSCCGDYYNDCCWHIQGWFIVFLLMFILCLLLFCAFVAIACRSATANRNKNRRANADV